MAANELNAAHRWRSYYAAYGFLAAALVVQPGVNFIGDREGSEHEAISSLVANHLKRPMGARTRSQVRLGVVGLYESRLKADYRRREPIRRQMATEALKRVATIANAVGKLEL